MRDILTRQDLWEHVTGTTSLPEDASRQEAWRKKEQDALFAIRLWVVNTMIVYVLGVVTVKEAWDSLRWTLEPQGVLGIVLVRRKLFWAQCEEGASIEDHIRTLQTYKQEMLSLGQKVDEEEFSII